MANIDQSLAIAPTSIVTETTGSQIKHKQAWLYSLEKATLGDTLSQVRVLESSAHTKNIEFQAGAQDGTSSYSEQKEASPALPSISSLGQNKVGVSPVAIANMIVQSPSSKAVDPTQGVLPLNLASNVPNESKFQVLERETTVSKVMPGASEYSWRNVVMLPSGAGFEIWVRDMTLPQSKLTDLLKGLRQSMGTLGVSLVKVVVNGQEIFSSIKPETKSPFREA